MNILEYLQSDDPEKQLQALTEILRTRDESYIEQLIVMARSEENPAVRQKASDVLDVLMGKTEEINRSEEDVPAERIRIESQVRGTTAKNGVSSQPKFKQPTQWRNRIAVTMALTFVTVSAIFIIVEPMVLTTLAIPFLYFLALTFTGVPALQAFLTVVGWTLVIVAIIIGILFGNSLLGLAVTDKIGGNRSLRFQKIMAIAISSALTIAVYLGSMILTGTPIGPQ